MRTTYRTVLMLMTAMETEPPAVYFGCGSAVVKNNPVPDRIEADPIFDLWMDEDELSASYVDDGDGMVKGGWGRL